MSGFLLIEPSKVRNIHVSRKTDNSMTVTCTPPTDLNGPPGNYVLKVLIGDSEKKTYLNDTCNFLVKDLSYSTEYTFQVRLPFLQPLQNRYP